MSFCVITLLASVALARDRPVVQTSIGRVRGTALGELGDEFLGIPYGAAARFEAAVVRTELLGDDPFDASSFGSACMQTLTATTTYGVEHGCHVLNVWRPAGARADAKLPVLLFIPGGSNDFGEAEPYNASTLAWAHGAVVASLNYRVGPFGFLAFSEDAASGARTGNWASTDVDAALVFLRREVAAFGGDASRLTLFGQSSGASLALLHAVLPGSSGLFEGVLSQSGSLGAASLADASETTRTLASYLNCTTTVKACMLERSAADLVYAQGVECFTPNNCAARTSWAPTVDGVALPKDPRHLVAEGLANDVDVALGANTNDSYLFVMSRGPLPRRAYEAALRDLAEGDEQHSAQLLALYPPSANPLADNVASLGWASSDSMLCGLGRLARAFAKFGRKGRVKLYRYNWWFQSTTQCKAVANWHPPEYGSMHQDEVSFVFGQPIFMNLGYTNCSAAGWPGYDPSCLGCVFDETEAAFSRAVGRLWTNFAAGTNATTDDDQAEWPSIESDRNILLEPTVSLRADGEMRMRSEPALGRADFCRVWDAIAQTH